MNFALSLDQFNKNQILFLETKKNIIMNGNFTKLIYSDSHITMNGLYFILPLHIQLVESVQIAEPNAVSRNIIRFLPQTTENSGYINSLINIEHQILEYFKQYYGINKFSVYILHDQLCNGSLKLFKDYVVDASDSLSSSDSPDDKKRNIQYLLKISGLWENSHSVGLTFKVIESIKRPIDFI